MNKTLLIILTISFFACGQMAESKQKHKDSSHASLITNNKKSTTSLDDDFNYVDDALYSDDEWAEDTIYGYIETKEVDTLNFAFNLKPIGNYNKLKAQIKKEQLRLNKLYLSKKDSVSKMQVLDSARNYITSTLVNDIIPHWYGMVWDMAGYSAIPQRGQVGCSYFVSNTLLHVGFNVNRYRLAQQGPENEAKSLDKNYKHYIGSDTLDYIDVSKSLMDRIIKENEPGLYFVGVSNHVGYFLIHNKELFVIQSNYGDLAVMLEYAETSEEFLDSHYYLSKITHNDNLIRKWLLNEEIKVILDKG